MTEPQADKDTVVLYTPDVEILPFEKANIGRPTKYEDWMAQKAYDILSEGKPKEAVTAALGIHKDTLYNWLKDPEKEEFSDAIKKGLENGLSWWLEMMRASSRGQTGINLGVGFIMFMRNVYNLKTKDDDNNEEKTAEMLRQMALLRAGAEIDPDDWEKLLTKKTNG